MSDSSASEDYKVTEVASLVVVSTKEGQPLGVDMVLHDSVGSSEDAVQLLQQLGLRVQDLGWNLNVLKRHAVALTGTGEVESPKSE